MDFLEARFDAATTPITLGGESYEIPRQGLGGHYAIQSLLSKMREQADKGRYAIVDSIISCFHFATGFPEDWIINQDPTELAEAFIVLMELNAPKDTMLWMKYSPKAKKTSADYSNRRLAVIVHQLASKYHWDEEYILDLPPEAIWCYMQEIMIDNYEDKDWELHLSEVGYDKHGNPRPLQKPAWYVEKDPKQTDIPDFVKPGGNVVKLGE